ncbi:MAG: 50S ribosomal protein L17 [Candidatus Gottesmanbacteria bacterium GW2011_GWA2_44_17]|uniref:50S ribosomal protein L17 n=1 Tax=Candidatus Gottesmanbacteria bacterium GW2011_GWA2_44_17 TaxID=1618444 RepID=A0A0G1HJH9_9BACT|nr:MAG: 50S ribosomal protein L17 [Candidatus Gottesmanbacteria bacterium GW2011_GWA2_44_17]
MNHSVFGKKLSRTKNERKRLFSNLIRDIILHGKIVTSQAKAKAVQPLMEKLISKAKKGTDANRRRILQTIPHGDIVDMLLRDAKDRFSQRTSGFTRIIKIGNIRSDGSEEVMLSFVDEAIVREPVKYEQKETKNKETKEIRKPVRTKKETNAIKGKRGGKK